MLRFLARLPILPHRWRRVLRRQAAHHDIKRLYADLLRFNTLCRDAGFSRAERKRLKKRLLRDMQLATDMLRKFEDV